MANKVKYGLKNVHYAAVYESGETVSYDNPPKRIFGAVNLTLSASGDKVEFYADDTVYYGENTNNGYEGTIEIALIPDEFRVDILGEIRDDNGALIEDAHANLKKCALMFEFDGDKNQTRHVLYSVLPSRPNVEGSTTTATKEPKTETLNIVARPALDTKYVKASLKPEDTGYGTFFDAVYLADAPVNSYDGEPLVFDKKAGGADVVITVSSTGTPAPTIKGVLLNGLPVDGGDLERAGLQVTVNKSVFTGLDKKDHTVTIALSKGNTVSITLTVIDTTE